MRSWRARANSEPNQWSVCVTRGRAAPPNASSVADSSTAIPSPAPSAMTCSHRHPLADGYHVWRGKHRSGVSWAPPSSLVFALSPHDRNAVAAPATFSNAGGTTESAARRATAHNLTPTGDDPSAFLLAATFFSVVPDPLIAPALHCTHNLRVRPAATQPFVRLHQRFGSRATHGAVLRRSVSAGPPPSLRPPPGVAADAPGARS